MSREKNLVKNTAVIALGNFFPKFLTVLITPILTAKLTKFEYGQYDLILTIVSLMLPIATLQISSAAFRFLITKRNSSDDCTSIISTIYAFIINVAFISGLVYYFVVGEKLGDAGIFVSLYFVFDILLITTQQVLRGLGKNLLYSLSAVIQAVVSLIGIFLLTGCTKIIPNFGLKGVIISLMMSTVIPTIILILIAKIINYIKVKKVDFSLLKKMIAYSWPMIPNNLSIWILNLSDRLIITGVLGIEANAMYAVANKMPTIFSSFQSTFIMAWQENASLAAEDADKDIYYSQMCDWVYRLLTGLMAGLIMCTPIIWKTLIKGEYEEAYHQLPILYMGMLFCCMSSTLGGIYIAHMKTKSVGITTMMAAGINFIINILLIKKIGIWAGSLSTMISYFSLWIFRMKDVQKFQKIIIDIKKIILSIVLLTLMAILNYQEKIIFDIINIFMCILVLILFDKDIVLVLFNKILKKTKQ